MSAESGEADAPEALQGWARPAYQTRSRAQRDRLLKAGERVFAESGFWQAHVADIARGAGCSVGSFYRRFKDKEAFFFGLQAHMADRAEANIAKFFEDASGRDEPLPTLFVRLARSTTRTMRGIEGYYRALFELSLRGHAVWPPMRRLERLEAEALMRLLESRGAAKADEQMIARAHLAIRLMHGQILSHILHGGGPFDPNDPRLAEELGLMMQRYLSLEPAA